MGRSLAREIAQLPATVRAANRVDVQGLRELFLRRAAGRPAVFVGSGGAVAAASFAAQLYGNHTGGIGYVQTPLELVGQQVSAERAGFLFTASGRHPDAAAAIKQLAVDMSPAAVITTNPGASVMSLCDRLGVDIVKLSNKAGNDGFLATNSLIAMTIAVARAFTGSDAPSEFSALRGEQSLPRPLNEVLVLFPPSLAAVAVDVEARLSETGLAAVQATDYRNFAHGRHYGLARRAKEVTVIALVDGACRRLAQRTLQELPPEIPQVRLESPLAPPWDVVDLLLRSIRLTAYAGEVVGLDAGRPRVPSFGRRLYRLAGGPDFAPTSNLAPAVTFKLRELGLHARRGAVVQAYQAAFEEWKAALRRTAFAAVVLDYDGTVVSTEGRYELPFDIIRTELTRLLAAGVTLGFASGRGNSLQEDLRRWVPKRHWPQVHLGLYNGAVEVGLEEALPRRGNVDPALAKAVERIQGLPVAGASLLADRHYQLQLTPSPDSGLTVPALARVVTGALRRPPPLPLEAVMSAHSVDILPAASTKVALLNRLTALSGGEALAIGDQGQLGGNDFALLAAQDLTLTVDRCSADPSRCWRLLRTPSGPRALCHYLAALQPGPRGLRFRWAAR